MLGVEHPDTVASMNNLAFTIKEQGRNLEAVHLMKECVHRQNRVLGDQNPRALSFFCTSCYYPGALDLSSRYAVRCLSAKLNRREDQVVALAMRAKWRGRLVEEGSPKRDE